MDTQSRKKRVGLRKEAERLQRLMQEASCQTEDDPEGGTTRKVLSFLLGSKSYALPLSVLEEVLAPPVIARVPFTPPHVTGLASIWGEVVPVLDLRLVFAAEASPPGERARVLVVGSQTDRVGLLVDAVAEVGRYDPREVQPLSGEGPTEAR